MLKEHILQIPSIHPKHTFPNSLHIPMPQDLSPKKSNHKKSILRPPSINPLPPSPKPTLNMPNPTHPKPTLQQRLSSKLRIIPQPTNNITSPCSSASHNLLPPNRSLEPRPCVPGPGDIDRPAQSAHGELRFVAHVDESIRAVSGQAGEIPGGNPRFGREDVDGGGSAAESDVVHAAACEGLLGDCGLRRAGGAVWAAGAEANLAEGGGAVG